MAQTGRSHVRYVDPQVDASSNACFRLGPDPRRALGPAAIRSGTTAYAWFVWDKDAPGTTELKWFKPGYRARFS